MTCQIYNYVFLKPRTSCVCYFNARPDIQHCCSRVEVGSSPVTLVPDPGLVSGARPEVGAAVVVYLGGEAQQPAVGGGVGGGGAAGQTVLLLGTRQRVHGPVLQVGGLLHHLGVQHEVWGRWRSRRRRRRRRRRRTC